MVSVSCPLDQIVSHHNTTLVAWLHSVQTPPTKAKEVKTHKLWKYNSLESASPPSKVMKGDMQFSLAL